MSGIPVATTPIKAERMLLVSDLETPMGWCQLDQALFVEPGERYWMEGWTLVVERLSGNHERHATNFGDPATRPR